MNRRTPKTARHRLKHAVVRSVTEASKREKLIFATCITTSLLLVTSVMQMPLWVLLFIITSAVTVALVLFALREDLHGKRYFFIPLFPLLFTQATALVLFVVPIPILYELPLICLFGIVFYLVLLIANIFNISATRTIPLIRAAHAASFFLVLVVVFFVSFFLVTLKLNPFLLVILSALGVYLPSLYFFWSFRLANDLGKTVKLQALAISVIVGQTALVLSLWPISPLFFALFITTMYYICAGMLHQEFVQRLERRIIIEYICVLLFALFLLILMAQWNG